MFAHTAIVTRHRSLGDQTDHLNKAQAGDYVTAALDIATIRPVNGGRVTASATNDGGAAILRFNKDAYAHLADLVHDGARLIVRGAVATVGSLNVIDVRSARNAA